MLLGVISLADEETFQKISPDFLEMHLVGGNIIFFKCPVPPKIVLGIKLTERKSLLVFLLCFVLGVRSNDLLLHIQCEMMGTVSVADIRHHRQYCIQTFMITLSIPRQDLLE